jgi:phenylalanyl-tRNA synthetase beta chain
VAKGLTERLAEGLGVGLNFRPATEHFLHPGKSATVEDPSGRPIGWVGEIHPLVLQEYELRGLTAVAAELDVELLIGLRPETPMFEDLSTFPPVEQDLALVVESVQIFDLYEGNQVPPGKKSLALRLSFRSPDRTLSEAEVNDLRSQMLAAVASSVGATLRV